MKSNRDNPDFQRAFRQALAAQQQPADAVEDGVRRALASRDQRQLETALGPVVECDTRLELPTPAMPRV